MDKETLRQVQLVQLEIAKEIKRVCEELGINYFLDSGTLLGAVRHKGFIPWDDDLDMGMLRDDYERFVKEGPNVLRDGYYIQTYSSDKAYDNIFLKVRKKNTIYREAFSPKSLKNNGVYVDIFPYDEYPDDEDIRKEQGPILDDYRMQIFAKMGTRPWSHLNNKIDIFKVKIKMVGYKLKSLFISKEKLFERYEKEIRRFNGEKTECYHVHSSACPYGKWVISSCCFNEYIELPFEDDFFKCPANYDLYLKEAYGDYMTLPPVEERENRHNIIELKL